MPNPEDPEDYEVGYGKPPKSTRFQPGQSGNPKGRPKGSKNLKTVVDEELNRTLSIRENGETRTMTSIQALLRTTMNKALKGDGRASAQMFDLARDFHGAEDIAAGAKALDDTDREILEMGLRRLAAQLKADAPDAEEPDRAAGEDADAGNPGIGGADE